MSRNAQNYLIDKGFADGIRGVPYKSSGFVWEGLYKDAYNRGRGRKQAGLDIIIEKKKI